MLQKTPRIDLEHLAVFVAVAEARSFSRAAKKLGVGKGTVSRTIAALEEQVGAELLHRTTHQVALSTAGAALLERTAPHLAALTEALTEIADHGTEPSGTLRLTAPHDFGTVVLPSILAGFSRTYPRIVLDVRLSNERLDLVGGGFDVAFRVSLGPLKDSTLTVRRLGRGMAACFASSTYLAARGRPQQLGEAGHDWLLHHGIREVLPLPPGHTPRVVSDDFFLLRDLMVAGVGVGVLPAFIAAPLVKQGQLEEVELATTYPATGTMMLLYPSSGTVPRKIVAFRDHVVDWFKRAPLS